MTNAVAQITNPVSPINGLDVVNAVNGFYSTAFNHTVWLLGALMTILGFVVPVFYFALAKWQLKLREQKLLEALEKRLLEANAKFMEDDKAIFKRTFEILESQTKKELWIAQGGIYHLQGNIQLDAGNNVDSAFSFTEAIRFYSMAGELKFVQQMLGVLTTGTLPKLKKSDFNSSELKAEFQDAVTIPGKIEAKGLLDVSIEKLKNAIATAQLREA